jgi:hypothetical protein
MANRLGQFSVEKDLTARTTSMCCWIAGALQAAVRDFNGDGRPDILVMMAQAREGVYLFLNEGQAKFRLEPS